jgi:MinD-like ATPase involved in chromosome partitioning or flagellar assembly
MPFQWYNEISSPKLSIFKSTWELSTKKGLTMATIISVHSFRGGTGKSNTTANVAAILATQGLRVGVIDTDIQSPGIHILFGLEGEEITASLNDYLWHGLDIKEAALDVTANMGQDINVLLIDTHPGLNEETLLSIVISDGLAIVMRPDKQDYEGTGITVKVARELKVPNLMLVVNKAPLILEPEAIRIKVEQTYGCEVAAVLPHSDDLMNLASEDIFVWRYPNHPISALYRQVATKLIT